MRKILSAVFILMGVGMNSASAASQKVFQPATPNTCKLAKFVGGKWVQVNERDVTGRVITNITASKANGDFSNFKFQGTWFATRNECIKDGVGIDGGSGLSDTSGPAPGLPYYVELKLQKYLMMGSNTGSSNSSAAGVNIAADPYKTGIGFDGRFGYRLSNGKILFLDMALLTASQNLTYTGNLLGTPQASDSIFKVNVGYQVPFSRSSLRPYFAGSLGYAKLTGTVVGAVNGGTLGVAYSAGGFDLALEAGIMKEFNRNWSVVGSLGFTYLSLNPKVDQSNALGLYNVGDSLITRGYSHLTLALGARYSF